MIPGFDWTSLFRDDPLRFAIGTEAASVGDAGRLRITHRANSPGESPLAGSSSTGLPIATMRASARSVDRRRARETAGRRHREAGADDRHKPIVKNAVECEFGRLIHVARCHIEELTLLSAARQTVSRFGRLKIHSRGLGLLGWCRWLSVCRERPIRSPCRCRSFPDQKTNAGPETSAAGGSPASFRCRQRQVVWSRGSAGLPVGPAGVFGMSVLAWRLGPIPMPLRLRPVSFATEGVDSQGCVRFDVEIRLPLSLGQLVRY